MTPDEGGESEKLGPIDTVGVETLRRLSHIGMMWYLLTDATVWLFRACFSPKYRLGRTAIVSQMCASV